MPVDYKRVLAEQKQQKLAHGDSGVTAGAE